MAIWRRDDFADDGERAVAVPPRCSDILRQQRWKRLFRSSSGQQHHALSGVAVVVGPTVKKQMPPHEAPSCRQRLGDAAAIITISVREEEQSLRCVRSSRAEALPQASELSFELGEGGTALAWVRGPAALGQIAVPVERNN